MQKVSRLQVEVRDRGQKLRTAYGAGLRSAEASSSEAPHTHYELDASWLPRDVLRCLPFDGIQTGSSEEYWNEVARQAPRSPARQQPDGQIQQVQEHRRMYAEQRHSAEEQQEQEMSYAVPEIRAFEENNSRIRPCT